MKAVVSWRKIGDWVVELGGEKPVPILDMIKLDSLQVALRQWWPNCRVTYDKRSWSSIVIREVPYTDIQALLDYLWHTYQTHPVTTDRIRWEVGEIIG